MKEQDLQRRLLTVLNKLPKTFAVNYSCSIETGAGIPDVLACIDGQFYGIEIKHGSKVGVHQETIGEIIRKAGGKWVVLKSNQAVTKFLKEVKEMVT